MEHAQVLKYLHVAREEGRANPIDSSPGGIIRGCVPAGVEAQESPAEKNAKRAATAVGELFDGRPVSAAAVGRHLRTPKGTVGLWLKAAEKMKLVVSLPRRGWQPV